MCGRFTLRARPGDLVEVFELLCEPELTPRFNIAPTQPVAVVRQVEKHRELSMMRWGLIPFWAEDPKVGYSTGDLPWATCVSRRRCGHEMAVTRSKRATARRLRGQTGGPPGLKQWTSLLPSLQSRCAETADVLERRLPVERSKVRSNSESDIRGFSRNSRENLP